jgi:hypothetical protein
MSSWSHRIAGSQSLALLTAVLVIGLLVGPIAAAAEEGATPVAPPAGAAPESVDPSSQVKEWIDQLGSDQFAQREAASRSLAEAGLPALKALTGAIHGDDLEVASRAIEIVRRFLEGGDEALAVEAEKLFEAIAEGPDTPVSSLAIAMLDFHHLGMVEAAREKLESLGAIITEGFITTGSRGLIVMLNSNWQGGADDLRLLTRLRGVVQVGLRGVESFQVYGTGISAEALAALAAKHPDAEIDFRKGGKLGVGGQPMAGPCLITMVQEESAAAKAGLQIGDIVVKIDGEPVANFEALTDKVGQHGPGEKIELDIERNFPGDKPQRFSRTIALDGWD